MSIPYLPFSMLFFFIFCLLLASSEAMITPNQEEAQALLAVKFHLTDNAGRLRNWNLSYPPVSPCLWSGLACDSSGSVVSLDLTGMNLTGSLSGNISGLTCLVNLTLALNNITGRLPLEISEMTSLRFINVSNNLFSGSLPANLSNLRELSVLDCYNNNMSGKLPLEVSELRNLRHLHLGGNYFEGSIPPQYSNLINLTYLALSGNSLTGKIPPEVSNLAQLEELYLGYYNQYDGGIPPEIGRLSNLLRLDIADCGLTGELPEELGNLTKLNTLFLQINSLTGTIPLSFGKLISLRSLDLSNNQLTGSFPVELAKLAKLELVSLFRNEFHGSIPSFFGDLPKLQVLYLWENNITGKIPQHLGSNRQLQRLDLSSNALTGPIPPQLCLGGKLERVILLNNFLTGSIPASLGECQTLDRLRLGQNLLTGSLSAALFSLPLLHIIEVPHNNLSGSFPTGVLGRNPSLGRLDLSGNQITGIIPSSIGYLTGLQTLLLPGNLLTGEIPPEIRYLKVLSKVDLSGNLLTGSIPREIAQCNVLTMLDLSRNQLVGEIPAQLQNLTVLDYFNVSRNYLTGPIPSSLQEMQTLTVADFSFNALSGPIPEEGQFSNFNSSSFLGNPGLCGIQLISQPCSNNMGSSSSGSSPESNHRGVKSKPGLVSWLVLVVISSLTIVVFVGGIFCNRQALAAFISRYNHRQPACKLLAFQRFDFNATHVLNCLTEDNIIGKGGAGTVYKCVMPNGEAVAVKMLPGIRKGSSNDHGFSAEIQTLGKIRHRHIVRLLGCCSNEDTNLLVYEFMQNGSLGELLHGPKGSSLDWPSRYRIAVEAAKGLCYLHHDCSPIIVHRDVKSNNILLDSNFEAHVADFGLAKVLLDTGKSESMSSIAGSYGYIAPEYAYTLKVDEKSDIYSFGVVLLELLTGRRPIEPEYGEGGDIVQWVKKMVPTKQGSTQVLDSRMNLGEGCAEPMQEVMLVLRVALLCLEELPLQRPTMREVLQMLTELLPKFKESSDNSSNCSNELVMSIPMEKACLLT